MDLLHAGQAYADELCDAELPGIAGRLLPKERIEQMQDLLEERGPRVVFFGRLAAFPSTLMAAAAGASGVPVRSSCWPTRPAPWCRWARCSSPATCWARPTKRRAPWLSVVALIALAAAVLLLGRYLRNAAESS